MRRLKEQFFYNLSSDFLYPLIQVVQEDWDLDLEIRDNSITIYFKGHDLLTVNERNQKYIVSENEFYTNLDAPKELSEEEGVHKLISIFPVIKQNIISHAHESKKLIEQEFEQLVIRANGHEKSIKTEYFITDRQYQIKKDRFDLLGIYCKKGLQNTSREVPMCLIEVKYGQNTDISNLGVQLERYYSAVKEKDNINQIAEDCERVFRQKLDLGLFEQDEDRIRAMKKLNFSRKIEDFQFIVVLVDFNPISNRLRYGEISNLKFHDQVRIYQTGLALWEKKLLRLK